MANLINNDMLALKKPTATLINAERTGLAEDWDIIDALKASGSPAEWRQQAYLL